MQVVGKGRGKGRVRWRGEGAAGKKVVRERGRRATRGGMYQV